MIVVTDVGSVTGSVGVCTTGGVDGAAWRQPQVMIRTKTRMQVQYTHLMMGMWGGKGDKCWEFYTGLNVPAGLSAGYTGTTSYMCMDWEGDYPVLMTVKEMPDRISEKAGFYFGYLIAFLIACAIGLVIPWITREPYP